MKTALFIRNAFLNTSSFLSIQQDMEEAAKKQGFLFDCRINADFVPPSALENLPPVALFWDKDIRLAKLLEHSGLRLLNPAQSIEVCDDKTLTYLSLKDLLPMPQTLLCPKTFEGLGYGQMEFLDQAALALGLPFVIKEGYGSYGSQVYLVHSVAEAKKLLSMLNPVPILFQKFVQESAGRDVRAYVVNGQVVAAMERINLSGDFRANIADGGRGLPYALSKEEEEIALQACRLLNLDFAGVDLLFSKDGPLLCEVNSNAHFEALKTVTGLNPADSIAKMIRDLL